MALKSLRFQCGSRQLCRIRFEHVFLQHVLLVDLGRRNANALFEDLPGVRRQAARDLAADVGHVAEHRGIGDQPAVLEDRAQQQPVVVVTDGAVAGVRIGREEHVALFDRPVVGGLEAVDEAAELADDHLAVDVGDHRELVVLFPDARRHGGAEQHRVHLEARIEHRVLDDIQGDRINLDPLERRGAWSRQSWLACYLAPWCPGIRLPE